MNLTEEQKEAYRILMEQLHEIADTLEKLPSDPVTCGLVEMAAEMVNRQVELDIAFPPIDHQHDHGDNEQEQEQEPPRLSLAMPPQNLSSSEEVEEITDPEDFTYLGHQIIEPPSPPENSSDGPSADELKRWYDGYSSQ